MGATRRTMLSLAATLGLAALGPARAASPIGPAGVKAAELLAKLAQSGRGFAMQPGGADRPQVRIAFDSQCTDGHKLWFAVNALASRVAITWYPVAVMNRRSESQGAALLAAADPVASMEAHLAAYASPSAGLLVDAQAISDELRDAVWLNTNLLRRAGALSVPVGVLEDTSGQVLVFDERAKSADLRRHLGLA